MLVLFAILQFGAVYNDYVTLTDATRVGARKAATSRHSVSPEADAEAVARVRATIDGLQEHGVQASGEVLDGDGRDEVCAMLNIDLVAVGSWAERNNVVYGSYQELANHPRVYEMIEKHVDEVNRWLDVTRVAPTEKRSAS